MSFPCIKAHPRALAIMKEQRKIRFNKLPKLSVVRKVNENFDKQAFKKQSQISSDQVAYSRKRSEQEINKLPFLDALAYYYWQKRASIRGRTHSVNKVLIRLRD